MEDRGSPKGEAPVAIAIFATIVSAALVQGRDNSNVIQSPSVAYGYFTGGRSLMVQKVALSGHLSW